MKRKKIVKARIKYGGNIKITVEATTFGLVREDAEIVINRLASDAMISITHTPYLGDITLSQIKVK